MTVSVARPRDLCSLSSPHEVVVTHLDWNVSVDFGENALTGEATYSIEPAETGNVVESSKLDLDTAHLSLDSVTDKDGNQLDYRLLPCRKPHLGSKLSIALSDAVSAVKIKYRTTDKCTAIQWLQPSQTAGKVYPYLFTQCQAIHARSIVPCQDSPVRFILSS